MTGLGSGSRIAPHDSEASAVRFVYLHLLYIGQLRSRNVCLIAIGRGVIVVLPRKSGHVLLVKIADSADIEGALRPRTRSDANDAIIGGFDVLVDASIDASTVSCDATIAVISVVVLHLVAEGRNLLLHLVDLELQYRLLHDLLLPLREAEVPVLVADVAGKDGQAREEPILVVDHLQIADAIRVRLSVVGKVLRENRVVAVEELEDVEEEAAVWVPQEDAFLECAECGGSGVRPGIVVR